MANKIIATAGESDYNQADYYDVAASLSANLRLTESNVNTLARRGTFRYGIYYHAS